MKVNNNISNLGISIIKFSGFVAAFLSLLGYFVLGGWYSYFASPISIFCGITLIAKKRNKNDFISGITCLLASGITIVYLLSVNLHEKFRKIPFIIDLFLGVIPMALFLWGILIYKDYKKTPKNRK